jgi:hypothetical protein
MEEYPEEFRRVPLHQLHLLCKKGNADALTEWKRRWKTEYPNIAEIEKKKGKLIIPYFKK